MSKDLSIIIVNYNVRSFLRICLYSVTRALKTINAEVFVVDNASHDDSVNMVETLYAKIQLIRNERNVGFSMANNQAIQLAQGKIVVLLNPDTIVAEDTFTQLLAFYQDQHNAAGVGVKMIDGSGHFLPESKRGVPTPSSSFFKFSGLARFFPRSGFFSSYHMGHIQPDQMSEVPVLAGAFLAFPKVALEDTDPLDESFFMYGEDIDFSHRLRVNGRINYYYPPITIIHFKGESTSKDKQYIDRFFGAMHLFAKKHFFPTYPAWKKTALSMSIKGLAVFSLTLNKINPNKQPPAVSFNKHSQAVFFGSSDTYSALIQLPGFNHVAQVDSGLLLSAIFSRNQDKEKQAILFDVAHLAIKDMIGCMQKYRNKASFYFLSPDCDFILSSSHSNSSGHIQYISFPSA